MTLPPSTATPTSAALRLVFGDISWELQGDHTASPHCGRRQTIRVVEEIRSDKVYGGKFYKDNYTPGKCPTREVVIKVAGPTSKPKDFERLEQEYTLYSTFSRFQGIVFPECLGIFRTYSSNGYATIVCLVLEKCIPSATYDKDEFNRQLMLAVCKLHEVDFIHNGLLSNSHILRHGTSPRIVDLSQAMHHRCRGGHPANNEGTISEEFRSCWELVKLEKRLWNDHDFEEEEEKPSSYISQIVEAGAIYMSKGLGAIMGNK